MKTNLVLSLALSAFAFLPLTAQQGTAPSTPDNQNPPQRQARAPLTTILLPMRKNQMPSRTPMIRMTISRTTKFLFTA